MSKSDLNQKLEAARQTLKKNIEQAVKTHGKAKVREEISRQIFEYQMLTLVSTKNGFAGAPDFDKLKACIGILEEALKELGD